MKNEIAEFQRRMTAGRKPRTCLRCGREFMSAGPWNRRCERCERRDDYLPRGGRFDAGLRTKGKR